MLHLPDAQSPARNARSPAARKSRVSAMDVISAEIQPIREYPDLQKELALLSAGNEVAAVLSLYDAYASMARAVLSIINQPRSAGVDDLLEREEEQAWAKAYLVASVLKEMTPCKHTAEAYLETLLSAAIQMGGNFAEAVAVAKDIGARFQTKINSPA